ncbi:hypothetical protein [Verminephrobacter aporrectodeae]|uniref:hypothetical protein n=1 Tax=Verminephrobacter aporrectodeae TaxID=1110389 RepID=UPI002244A43A|nr:hypothetical protein [Verminephrobacter aporrectodeae]
MSTGPRYLVRAADVPAYQPTNHEHTRNQRLIYSPPYGESPDRLIRPPTPP